MVNKLTQQEFINRANKIHNFRYDYIKTNYIGANIKVIITCKDHGDFKQQANSHLRGTNCPQCAINTVALFHSSNTNAFIEKANKIHNYLYKYNKVNYVNNRIEIIINCVDHGDFNQKPVNHLSGRGCHICGKKAKILTQEEFVVKANKIHNNIYDYSLINYVNSIIKLNIICKQHGPFEQSHHSHLEGHGCPKCLYKGQSHTEYMLQKILNNCIIYSQYKIIINNNRYFIDFYFNYNNKQYAVEYNGRQHYEPVTFGGCSINQAKVNFEKQKERDDNIIKYCYINNIQLLTIDSRKISIENIENYLINNLLK